MPLTPYMSSIRQTDRNAGPRFGFRSTATDPYSMMPPDTVSITHTPNRKTILPKGTPVFLLHGTFAHSGSLDIPARTFGDHHPVYRSYLPEDRYSTGIDQVGGEARDSASRMAARDMGDFRFQLLHQNLKPLKALKQQLEKVPEQALRNRLIGEYFGIVPEMRKTLGPIIEEALLQSVFEPKDGLQAFVAGQIEMLQDEAARLVPKKELPSIIDTHWFRETSESQGKEVNWYSDRTIDREINPRIISSQAVDTLGMRLNQLERLLTEGFAESLARRFPDPAFRQAIEETSRNTAIHILQQLAPKGLAYGHSQGGSILNSALVNYLEQVQEMEGEEKWPKKTGSDPPKSADGVMGAAFIGFFMPVCAALQGLPHNPYWLNISEIEAKLAWDLASNGAPGISDTRKGSSLTRRFEENFYRFHHIGLSGLAVHEEKDGLATKDAASFPDDIPRNFHNHATNQPRIPTDPKNPEKITMILLGKLMPGLFKSAASAYEWGEMMVDWNDSLIKMWQWWIPEKLRKGPGDFFRLQLPELLRFNPALGPIFHEIERKYDQGNLEQHWSPIVFSDRLLGEELTEQFLMKPALMADHMDTVNFEPFRRQVLAGWRERFRQEVMDLARQEGPTEGFDALKRFLDHHPGFVDGLLKNAQEGTATLPSASQDAREMLGEILAIIENRLSETLPLTRPETARIKNLLTRTAQTDLLPVGQPSATSQARRLLDHMASANTPRYA